MSTVRFNRMVCDNPEEDDADGDEVFFTFHADNSTMPTFTNVIDHLNPGDIRNLTDRFPFSSGAEIKLFENDPENNSAQTNDRPGPADDLLGTLRIEPNQLGNHDGVFETADARYVLNYDVLL